MGESAFGLFLGERKFFVDAKMNPGSDSSPAHCPEDIPIVNKTKFQDRKLTRKAW